MEFIVSQYANGSPVAATQAEQVIVMPTQPVSLALIHVNAKLTAGTSTDAPATFLSKIGSIQYRWRGTQIWAMGPSDLISVTRAVTGRSVMMDQFLYGAGADRGISLCIPFSRKPFDTEECFPATAKNESELFIAYAADPTGYNTYTLSVEVVQLPDAKPKGFIRATTISSTPGATGDTDYDLPRSANVIGIGIAQTSARPPEASATLSHLKLLANNRDYGYSLISQAGARYIARMRGMGNPVGNFHGHADNLAATYTQAAGTGLAGVNEDPLTRFSYLDYDPDWSGKFWLPANTFNELKLRLLVTTAAAIRILPVEWWDPARLTGGAAK